MIYWPIVNLRDAGIKKIDYYKSEDINNFIYKILSIIEKPEKPNYCVTGIFAYDHDVFTYIEKTNPSNRNELEITDVNNLYIENNQLQFDILTGWWINAGTHESLFKAFQYVNKVIDKDEIN